MTAAWWPTLNDTLPNTCDSLFHTCFCHIVGMHFLDSLLIPPVYLLRQLGAPICSSFI